MGSASRGSRERMALGIFLILTTTVGLCFSQGKGGKHGLVNFGNDYQGKGGKHGLMDGNDYQGKGGKHGFMDGMDYQGKGGKHGFMDASDYQGKGGKHGFMDYMDYQGKGGKHGFMVGSSGSTAIKKDCQKRCKKFFGWNPDACEKACQHLEDGEVKYMDDCTAAFYHHDDHDVKCHNACTGGRLFRPSPKY